MIQTEPSKGKLLLFSYAFPPMQVQMSPAVFKPMSALARLGYDVDVLCADSFCPHLTSDFSLLPFVDKIFPNVHRLSPVNKGRRFGLNIPDLMAPLHQIAYQSLMSMDLSSYRGIMTWSPFHSINAVMVKVKQQRKNIPWFAQFCDPWMGNPLEMRSLNKIWNAWHEPKALKKVDYLVHSSAYSLNLMLSHSRLPRLNNKFAVLPHAYSELLYPQHEKKTNAKIILRYIGVLYGRRSPEPLFKALHHLITRRKDLRDIIQVELIGSVPQTMLTSEAALALPKNMVHSLPNVDYVKSLELMYDADILLLIEADIRQNLFLPSKLSDYLGANTPIVGLVAPGSSQDILQELGAWYAHPHHIEAISLALEKAIRFIQEKTSASWGQQSMRNSFKDEIIANQFAQIIEST